MGRRFRTPSAPCERIRSEIAYPLPESTRQSAVALLENVIEEDGVSLRLKLRDLRGQQVCEQAAGRRLLKKLGGLFFAKRPN